MTGLLYKGRIKNFLFILLVLFCPKILNAQVIITEIMYNPEGSDDGKEWVEIWNDGSEAVDLSNWKFFEANTSHKLASAIEGGSLVLSSNTYAVIVDRVDKFFVNNPGFSGIVLDSAFSLSNSGEKLSLKDIAGNESGSVSYLSEWGANGDGKSLQLSGSSWVAASSTLGRLNGAESSNEIVSSAKIAEPVKNLSQPIEQKIFVNAGEDRVVFVGADNLFTGLALGLEKEPLVNVRFSWSFGDGGSGEGESVLHSYQYPGKYVVILNVSSGKYVSNDRLLVQAVDADLIISKIDFDKKIIELNNLSGYEMDLSWWKIKSGDQIFSFPKNTLILNNQKLAVPFSISGLNFPDSNNIYILYPNGDVFYKYQEILDASDSKSVIMTAVSEPITKKTILTEKKREEIAVPKINEQTAFVLGAEGLPRLPFNKWTFIFVGFILLSVIAILFFLKNEKEIDSEQKILSADDFKIIE